MSEVSVTKLRSDHWLHLLMYGAEKAWLVNNPIPTLTTPNISEFSDGAYRRSIDTDNRIISDSNARQSGKLALTASDLDLGLVGTPVEVTPLDSEEDVPQTTIAGTLTSFDLETATISILTAGGRTEVIRYAQIDDERDTDTRMLSSRPLVELQTDAPYKF